MDNDRGIPEKGIPFAYRSIVSMIEERRKRHENELHEKYLQLYYNNTVFAIRRTAGNEELICLANFSEYGQNAWLNCLEGEYEDLFTGEKLEMNSIWMNPYQYRWCVKK